MTVHPASCLVARDPAPHKYTGGVYGVNELKWGNVAYVSRPQAEIFYQASDVDGPVLLLGHGFFMDSEMFDRQQAAAAEAGVRLVTWDARGHGQTKSSGAFDYWDSAADALAVLDALGIEQAFIGGMSQGGYAALRTALQAPQRVQGLVLIDTEATACTEEEAAGYREFFGAWFGDIPLEPLTQGLAPRLIGGTAEDQAPWVAKWLAGDRLRWREPAEALITRDSVADRLGEIIAPALIVRGEDDETATAAKADVLAGGLPNAEPVRTIAGAGHGAVWTHPQLVGDEIFSFVTKQA